MYLSNVKIEGTTTIGSYAFYQQSISNLSVDDLNFIGDYAFYGSDISNAGFDDVNSIGSYAFAYSELSNFRVDGCKTVGDYAFYKCEDISNINLGGSLVSIDDYAFAECVNISNFSASNTLRTIGDYAFANCGNLSNFNLGGSVTTVGAYAFYNCSRISNINIGNNVTSIGEHAFDGCRAANGLNIGTGIKTIPEGTFNGCAAISSITVGSNVTSISSYAFAGCTGVTSVSISSSVTSISGNAFVGIKFCYSNGTAITDISVIAGHTFTGSASAMIMTGGPTPPPASSYTVSYNTNGGTGAVPSSTTVSSGSTYTVLFTPAPSKSGQAFLGWSQNASASTATYTANGTKTITVNSDITLYAIYQGSTPAGTYTVTYDRNGGTGDIPNSVTVQAGNDYQMKFAYIPSKAGQYFIGWTDVPGGTTAKYTVNGTNTIRVYGDTTLYAIFGDAPLAGVNYNTYDLNGGTGYVFTEQLVYNKNYTVNASATKTGYLFNGWLVDGKILNKGDSWTCPQHNTVFVAQWIYNGDDDSGSGALGILFIIAVAIALIAVALLVKSKKKNNPRRRRNKQWG